MIYIDENILLRKWQKDDADALSIIANNYNIAKNLSNQYPYPYSLEDATRFIKEVSDLTPLSVFAIEYKGKLAGSFGYIFHKDIWKKNVELGYWLAEEYWGNGIMTKIINIMINYAFQNFNINRIFAKIFGNNIGSQKVCEKAGMKKEAVLEKTLYKNGKYYDEIIYSIQRNQPFKNYLDIFNKTKYYFSTNANSTEIFINKKNPKIASQIQENKGWALITAFNPLPDVLTEQENKKRNKLLQNDLENLNLSFYDAFSTLENWNEKGFLIKNSTLNEACKLGKKYGQVAIIYSFKNKPAELVFIM